MKERSLVNSATIVVAGVLSALSSTGPAWTADERPPAAAGPARKTESVPFAFQAATPESQGMSTAKLDALKESLAARQTKALLVIRHDKIVHEWYAEGHGPAKTHFTASMAKALVGGLSLAVAATDGRIALDDKAAKYIPAWQSDPRKSQITVRQLGSHASGLEDAEADDLPHKQLSGWQGDFWKRLDVPRDPFTISRDTTPAIFAPGTKFQYSNPGIAVLGYAVTAALRDAPHQDLRALLAERVMRPIGVPDKEWSVGYGKTYLVDGLPLVAAWGGGSYTAQAAARVGRLMLREGDWDGQRLIDAEAVRQTTRDAGTPGDCGQGWWSNNGGRYSGLPLDAYWAAGAGHQILLVVPSLQLIAVRNGGDLDSRGQREAVNTHLFQPLLKAVTRSAPDKANAAPHPPSPAIALRYLARAASSAEPRLCCLPPTVTYQSARFGGNRGFGNFFMANPPATGIGEIPERAEGLAAPVPGRSWGGGTSVTESVTDRGRSS